MQDKLRASLRDVRIPAAIISLVLSAWSVFLDDVVNNDGVLYLRAADLLVHGEWDAAFNLYKWPFYSLLIAVTGQITGFSLEYSAHLLNAVLSALAVVCFISLVREVGGDSKTVLVAALVVLLYPGINEYRSFIGRDAGYIAFYLLSLLLLFKYVNSPRFGYAIGWPSLMFVAALFRIEGFVFVAMLPFLFYLDRRAGRGIGVGGFSALVGAAFGLAVVLAWWFGGSITAPDPKTIGPEPIGLLQSLWETTTTAISTKITLLGETLLTKHASDHASIVFFVSLLVILLAEILGRLTLINAALVGHALYHRLIFPMTRAKTTWIWLVLLNLTILAILVLVRQFVPGRLPLALSLTLMLAVPFSLVALYERWRDQRTKRQTKSWLFPAACVLILLFGLDGLYSPTGKTYLKEAGIWLRDNTPAQSTLLTNNQLLMFYAARNVYSDAGRFLPSHGLDFIKNKEWQDYDYLAIRIKSKQEKQKTSLIGTLSRDPVMRFANRKGDEVLIFKVH